MRAFVSTSEAQEPAQVGLAYCASALLKPGPFVPLGTTPHAPVASHAAQQVLCRDGCIVDEREIVWLQASPADAPPWAPPTPRVDNTLVKAVVRARRWRATLETNLFASVRELVANWQGREDQRVAPSADSPIAGPHRNYPEWLPGSFSWPKSRCVIPLMKLICRKPGISPAQRHHLPHSDHPRSTAARFGQSSDSET